MFCYLFTYIYVFIHLIVCLCLYLFVYIAGLFLPGILFNPSSDILTGSRGHPFQSAHSYWTYKVWRTPVWCWGINGEQNSPRPHGTDSLAGERKWEEMIIQCICAQPDRSGKLLSVGRGLAQGRVLGAEDAPEGSWRMSRSLQSRAEVGTGHTWRRAGVRKTRDKNSQVSVQRTRSRRLWLKVGNQVRQGPAGHNEEFEFDSQCSRRLLRVFSRPVLSFKNNSLLVCG